MCSVSSPLYLRSQNRYLGGRAGCALWRHASQHPWRHAGTQAPLHQYSRSRSTPARCVAQLALPGARQSSRKTNDVVPRQYCEQRRLLSPRIQPPAIFCRPRALLTVCPCVSRRASGHLTVNQLSQLFRLSIVCAGHNTILFMSKTNLLNIHLLNNIWTSRVKSNTDPVRNSLFLLFYSIIIYHVLINKTRTIDL